MSDLPTNYTDQLFDTLKGFDQKSMSPGFRKTFIDEADAGGFTRGSKSLIVAGPNAVKDCQYAFACLMRGQYAVAMIDARLITRRLDSKWIPRWNETDDKILEGAECIIVQGLFDPDLVEAMTPSEIADLTWFLGDCLNNGVMIVAPTTNKNADLNLLGESFGDLLEQHSEVDHGKTTSKTPTKKRPNGNKQHGGDETASKCGRQHKRKNAAGYKP